MYPAQFTYERVESIDGALALLEEHEGSAVELLAGGHSLLPTMKAGLASPDVVIDIGGIDVLRGVDRRESAVRLGALTTYSTIAGDAALATSIPAVTEAARAIGDRQVRNRGTIGGNLAHADPASDLPAAVLAAGATMHVDGPDGERTIPADDFFTGVYSTAIDAGELLTAIEVPTHEVGVYAKKPSPASGYAMVGVAAVLTVADAGTVESARVAATGAIDHAVRLPAVEDALEGAPLDDGTLQEAASHAAEGIENWRFMDDTHASAAYRRSLLGSYTERALVAAADGGHGLAAD